MSKKEVTQEDLDEIMQVMSCLRQDCAHITSARKAVKFISEKTEIPEDRVKKIIVDLGNKK